MRSLARLFSSSRRAPPNAASNCHSSSAWRSASVFITCVWMRRAGRERRDAARDALLVDMDEQVETELRRGLVAERDHLPELPRRVDVQQRERQP